MKSSRSKNRRLAYAQKQSNHDKTGRVERKRAARRSPRVDHIHSEYTEQCTVINWLALHENRYPEFKYVYAVPNGAMLHKGDAGKERKVPEAVKLKREGMKPGVPDLVCTAARAGYFGLYIEMKRSDGGNGLSTDQVRWRKHLVEQGYLCVQANGHPPAVELLLWYIKQPRTDAVQLTVPPIMGIL